MKKKRTRIFGLLKTKRPHKSSDLAIFSIIGVNNQTNEVWVGDKDLDLETAKNLADEKMTADICYYVYDGSNRIVYTATKE